MELSVKDMMLRGLLPNPYEIKRDDVGKYLDPDYGPVIRSDVGRLVFLRRDLIQMESVEQTRTRAGKK